MGCSTGWLGMQSAQTLGSWLLCAPLPTHKEKEEKGKKVGKEMM